jgi:hypothetical protein
MRSSDYGQVLDRTCESQGFGPRPASCRVLRNKLIAREQIRSRRFAGTTVTRRAAQRRLLDCRFGIQALVAHPPTIWSLTIDPVDPDILFAGTRPAGICRSRDGGRQWEKLAGEVPRECSTGTPFVTSVIVDPDDHRMVWAGEEIDDVFRSLDGGDTWRRLNHDRSTSSRLTPPCPPVLSDVTEDRRPAIAEPAA